MIARPSEPTVGVFIASVPRIRSPPRPGQATGSGCVSGPSPAPTFASGRSRGAFNRYLAFYLVADDDVADVVRVIHSAHDVDRILTEE